jgi:hypothetical protein
MAATHAVLHLHHHGVYVHIEGRVVFKCNTTAGCSMAATHGLYYVSNLERSRRDDNRHLQYVIGIISMVSFMVADMANAFETVEPGGSRNHRAQKKSKSLESNI